jgi:hypothetical protein
MIIERRKSENNLEIPKESLLHSTAELIRDHEKIKTSYLSDFLQLNKYQIGNKPENDNSKDYIVGCRMA